MSRYCVIDFETTGLGPDTGEIVEFAAVRVQEGEIGLHIASLCRPRQGIPAAATAIHGITERMVRFARPFEEYIDTLLDFIGTDTVVAHNIPFDMGFLSAYCKRQQIDFAPKTLCTLQLARRLCPELPSRSLGALAKHFGLEGRGFHRALDDAMVTARLLLILLSKDGAQKVPR